MEEKRSESTEQDDKLMNSKRLRKQQPLGKTYTVIGQGDKMIASNFSIPQDIVTQTGGVNEY